MNTEQCNICLGTILSTINVQNSDGRDVQWLTKLQFIVPELDWLKEYLICESCIVLVEQSWEFKKMVLNLENERKLIAISREVCNEEIDDFVDYQEDAAHNDESVVVCEVCLKNFVTETQLIQHKLQSHKSYLIENERETNNKQVKNQITTICETECINNTLEQNVKEECEIISTAGSQCGICQKKFGTEEKLNLHCTLYLTKFKCCVCDISHSSRYLLEVHLQSCIFQHTRKPEYQCDTCSNFYTTERNLTLHKKHCSKENILNDHKVYKCDICNTEFSTVKDLTSHNILKHSKDKKDTLIKKRQGRKPLKEFCCEICNEKFNYLKLVVAHCVSLHSMDVKSVKPYSCEKCDMRFASSANFVQHRHYHDKNRSHICSHCGKAFITKSDLTVHEYIHFNRRNYKCNLCDKAFNTNKNLRTHHLVVHTDRKLWKFGCSICEKRFPLKTNYDQHLRRHTGEKKYVCHICKKPFVSKSELQRHINLHSNIKAFKCNVCNNEYKQSRTYRTHLAKAHGIGTAKVPVREKKFVCHICPSQFYDRQKLTRHLCSHSGLKPFACSMCDKKFTDKSYLRHHLKMVHKVVEIKETE